MGLGTGTETGSSNAFDVIPGPLDHFTFIEPPEGPYFTGDPITMVIEARDFYDNLTEIDVSLLGYTRKGRGPSFTDAARPEQADPLYRPLIEKISSHGVPVKEGKFRAIMEVRLVNSGPVTIIVNSKVKKEAIYPYVEKRRTGSPSTGSTSRPLHPGYTKGSIRTKFYTGHGDQTAIGEEKNHKGCVRA